jgi:chemotaxis protein MotB
MAKKCPKCEEGAPDWMVTFSDMVTLLLTFFVTMFSVVDPLDSQLQLVLSAFKGLGHLSGGNTLQEGQMVEMGNNVESLPSSNRGRALDNAMRAAISVLQPEIRDETVRIKIDERGLVISLASDAFFEPGSAELDLERSKDTLRKVATLLTSPETGDRKFRIEGHTDQTPTDPQAEDPRFRWRSNWDLSVARSLAVFYVMNGYGVPEERFQVAGYSDTVPIRDPEIDGDTPENRAYNRRVDIVVLTQGHLSSNTPDSN